MSNSQLGAAVKILTFVPFALALYFYDIPNFAIVLTQTYLPFFVLSCSLAVVGILMKYKILTARFNLSKGSFAWGALLFGGSVFLYVYGSFMPAPTWYHFESLYLLFIGYLAIRVGTKFLRAMAPLLVLFAFSFAPFGLWPPSSEPVMAVALIYVDAVAFVVYSRIRFRSLLLPSVSMAIGFTLWYSASAFPSRVPVFLDLLIPLPFLTLFAPKARGFMLPSGGGPIACPGHTVEPDGFCSLCGKRISRSLARESFGPWGLVALGLITVILLFAQVPALAFIGGAPYDSQVTGRGFSASITPPTPAGWQVNSTTLYHNLFPDLYAVKNVYVPIFHPETKNYTVYYEVALDASASEAPNGGEIPGWTRISNNFSQVGPLQGYLTVYSASGVTMLSYQGKTTMNFLSGPSANPYYVGMAFVREFKNTNVAPDVAQFLNDIDSLWVPGMNNDVSLSNWSAFLAGTYADTVFIAPDVGLLLSILAMGWTANLAVRRDNRLDRFLTVSAGLPPQAWSCLSYIRGRRKHQASGLDLVQISETPQNGPEAGAMAKELERRGLIERVLVESGSDMASMWRSTV